MDYSTWKQYNKAGQILPDHLIRLGWHYCSDWDGLLIGPGMPEMACCTCQKKQ